MDFSIKVLVSDLSMEASSTVVVDIAVGQELCLMVVYSRFSDACSAFSEPDELFPFGSGQSIGHALLLSALAP
jgi:hypothetical protein